MNRFDLQTQDSSSFKARSWHPHHHHHHHCHHRTTHNINIMMPTTPPPPRPTNSISSSSSSSAPFYGNNFQSFPGLDDHDLVSAVVPAVTVVLEGRSICHRISLHNHASYHSLAKALRRMFVDNAVAGESPESGGDDDVDLSNAIPGHLVAYEDMENDLLLAGDLNWQDFVRVAKRIRILPAKGNTRKQGTTRRP